MSEQVSINPMKMVETIPIHDSETERSHKILSHLSTIHNRIKMIGAGFVFLICCNLYFLYAFSNLDTGSSTHAIALQSEPIEHTPVNSHREYVYDSIPDLSTSQSKHVINLNEYSTMDDDYKDNVFNNLDSIIVQDGELGTTRHQVAKVNWLFDEGDTMLLYTALGEVFALAANGTISMYNVANGARRLLESQVGWLEGKITDVIHHGSSYKEMRDRGKAYLKTREHKQKEIEIAKMINQTETALIEAQETGKDVEQIERIMEELQENQAELHSELQKLPLVEQKPLRPKKVDDFLHEQEMEKMQRDLEQEKIVELRRYKKEKEESIMNLIIDKNVTLEAKKREIKDIQMKRDEAEYMMNYTKFIMKDEMDSIKFDIKDAKDDVDVIRSEIESIIEGESDELKKQKLIALKEKMETTHGKLTFTELVIDEEAVQTYDRRPSKDRADFENDRYLNPECYMPVECKDPEQKGLPECEMKPHCKELERVRKDVEPPTEDRPDVEPPTEDRPDEEQLTEDRPDVEPPNEDEQPSEEVWSRDQLDNGDLKQCSRIRNKPMCICTNKETREIYRC